MRCVVKHPAGIDGIACGSVGEFPDNGAVRHLIASGLLSPVGADAGDSTPEAGALRAEFDAAWVEREASFARRDAARDARITELEVEVAQLKIDLEAATAPAKPAEG